MLARLTSTGYNQTKANLPGQANEINVMLRVALLNNPKCCLLALKYRE